MAEQTEPEETEESTGGGGTSLLIVILVMVLSLAAGAGGTYFMVAPSGAAPVTAESEEPEEEVSPGESFSQRLVTLEPFVVNVAGEGYPRFLKVKIELEAKSPEAKEELEARTPQLRDTTILLLASRRLPEITEFEGQALLKDDLRDRINQVVGGEKIASVMFTELVVQ